MGVYNSSGVNDDRKEYHVVSKKYLTFRSQHSVRITLPVLEGIYELLINVDVFQYKRDVHTIEITDFSPWLILIYT